MVRRLQWRFAMLAVGFKHYGPPETLVPLQVSIPEPRESELLVRVAATSVNPIDWRIRRGELRLLTGAHPFIPGADVAGVVERVGPGVSKFAPGQRVFAMISGLAGGGYAQFVPVAEAHAARVPDGVTLAEAAGVPLAGLTALQALRDRAHLAPGARVLVNGASGGVGSLAIQIARRLGAGHVVGVCSGRNTEWVRQLGADEVIDYTRQDVAHLEQQYECLFDAVGTLDFRRCRRLLSPRGVMVSVDPLAQFKLASLLSRLRGTRRFRSVLVAPSGGDLAQLAAWLEEGTLRPVNGRRYRLTEASDAHRQSETHHVRGKLVLVVDDSLAELAAAA